MSQNVYEAISRLTKDHRHYVFEGRPQEVGGRDTDLANLYFSIEAEVKSFYPLNGVPENVEQLLKQLRRNLVEAEERFVKLVDVMVDAIMQTYPGTYA